MFRNKLIIGLDVLNEQINVVALQYNKQKWAVYKSRKKRVPPFSEASDNIRANEISELFNELDLNTKNVVTSLSGGDTIVKILILPPLHDPEKELPQLMQYELERQLPISPSEAAYDYQIIKQTVDETVVLLAAVRRNRLNDHLDFMQSAGVFPTSVMPSFLMVFNALLASGLLSLDESKFIGIVRLSESVVDVIAVKHGLLSLARSFAVKEVETPYGVLRELRNTLKNFLNLAGEREPQKLIIVTEDENLPFGLTMESLTETLEFPCCEHHHISDEFAIGLVTGYLNLPQTVSLNLLKPLISERYAKQKVERKEKLLRLGPVIATLIMVAVAILLFNQTKISEEKLTEKKIAQQLFEQKKQEIADLKKLGAELQRRKNALRWVDAGYPSLSYRLYQVAMSTPQEVWLKGVSTPQLPRRMKNIIPMVSSLIVTGYAPSQAQIDDFTKQLEKRNCFSEVRQQSTEEVILAKEKLLLFQLSLKSKPIGVNSE